MPTFLPGNLDQQLADLAHELSASKLVLFGSRARRDYRDRSDIDLAVYGMPEANRAAFWMGLEELPTLLKFDVVHIGPGVSGAFLQNIERDGVTLYAKD